MLFLGVHESFFLMKNIGIKVSLISPSVLYAKENAIHVQKRQDREEKKRKKRHQNRPNPNIQCTNTKEKKEKNYFFKKGPNFSLLPQVRVPETCSTFSSKFQNSETLGVFHHSKRQSFKKNYKTLTRHWDSLSPAPSPRICPKKVVFEQFSAVVNSSLGKQH